MAHTLTLHDDHKTVKESTHEQGIGGRDRRMKPNKNKMKPNPTKERKKKKKKENKKERQGSALRQQIQQKKKEFRAPYPKPISPSDPVTIAQEKVMFLPILLFLSLVRVCRSLDGDRSFVFRQRELWHHIVNNFITNILSAECRCEETLLPICGRKL